MINYEGLLIGALTFIIIGVYHPIVIKAEYYFTKRCWWVFLVLGIVGLLASLFVQSVVVSILCGVFSFTNFWAIGEIIEQEKRVERGWFPKNEHRGKDKPTQSDDGNYSKP